MHYDLTILPAGVRVITEPMPEIRSVAVGCWVDTGTRDERPHEAGSSHFLEHLLFKGSDRLSARQISEAFDAVGAQSNAFTTKEYTCFWARLRDADLTLGLGLLAEMIRRPAFRPHEIDSERQVVLEEINMNEDDPADVAHEEFSQALFGGHDLERPILGTRESILGLDRPKIHDYWQRRYVPGSLVVAIAGNLDHEEVVARVDTEFGGWEGTTEPHARREPEFESRVRIRPRDTEQAHLVLGGPGLRRDDKRRFAASLLNHVLGSGMSSRLFREIREERGLAYAVYSFRLPYMDTGGWGVYVGTTPSQTQEVLRLVRAEIAEVAAAGITAEELERAKGHVKGSLAISMEDANSRMTALGRAELTGVEHLGIGDLVERFDAVTEDDIVEVAADVFAGPLALGAVGPFDEDDLAEFVR